MADPLEIRAAIGWVSGVRLPYGAPKRYHCPGVGCICPPGEDVCTAKKKADAKPTTTVKEEVERLSVINLKGSPECRHWLTGLSKKCLTSTPVIVRDALALWAAKQGYSAPPEL